MISKKMTERLNRQINREIYSAYLYAGMASKSASLGLKGFENWFLVQIKEELSHAKRMYDYVNESGDRVMLQDIEAPPQEYSSPIDLFEKTLEHEKRVTRMINDLVTLAKQEKDKTTEGFLQWYVEEQEEEEEHAGGVLEKIKKAVEDNGDKGVSIINEYLARRVFTPPEAKV